MNSTSGPQERDNLNAVEEFLKTPLFMQDLPTEEDLENNDTFQALQSLIYEGPAEEIALNFKNQGNDCFKAGASQYQNAIIYYTKGLKEKNTDMDLKVTLLVNRAAVNLELGNYGRVLVDCAAALHINHKHPKAYYRCIKALDALRRYDEAIQCCELGLSCNPDNTSFINYYKVLQEKVESRNQTLEKLEKEKQLRQLKDQELKDAIEKKGYKIIEKQDTYKVDSDQDSVITNSEDDTDENKIKLFAQNQAIYSQHGAHTMKYNKESDIMTFPVIFIYPEYNQSDLIDAFEENARFSNHFDVIFSEKAPWDVNNKYKADNLEIFTQVYSEDKKSLKLIRIGKQLTLNDVLKLNNYYITNGLCYFYIMPENDAFTKMFKKRFKNRKLH